MVYLYRYAVQAKFGEQADAQAVLGYLEQMSIIKNCSRPVEGRLLQQQNVFHSRTFILTVGTGTF